MLHSSWYRSFGMNIQVLHLFRQSWLEKQRRWERKERSKRSMPPFIFLRRLLRVEAFLHSHCVLFPPSPPRSRPSLLPLSNRSQYQPLLHTNSSSCPTPTLHSQSVRLHSRLLSAKG